MSKNRQNSLPNELDPTDRRILAALRENGRLSNADLAERVGLSATPCWNRVRRLENEGYIAGYAAILPQEKLGAADTVFIEITCERHDQEALKLFGETLIRMPEVLEVHLVSGDYDYLVRVAVDGTAGYERFLREKLYRLPGVRHTKSLFGLKALKRELSLDPLLNLG